MRVYEANRTAEKKRKEKHPSLPKKNWTAYLWFCDKECPIVKGIHPKFSLAELSKGLGRLWKELDVDRKQVNQTMTVQDKSRYERNMIAWHNKSRNSSEKTDDHQVDPTINPEK